MNGLTLDAAGGTSWLHRMSPIPKLAWMLAGVLFAFATFDWRPLLVVSAATILVAVSAGIGRRLGWTLLAFAPLAASILLIQATATWRCAPGCQPVAAVGPIAIYAEGLVHGISLVARVLTMEAVAFTVLLTIHPSDLFAALERLQLPRSLSLAASMTLQLVPILQRELRIVLAAQRVRGLRTYGPTSLARGLVPVIVASVERVEQVAISLESRGFGGRTSRTSFRGVAYTRSDGWLAIAGLVAGGAGIVAGIAWWGPVAAGPSDVSAALAMAIVTSAAVVFATVILRALWLAARA
ncbi:MAG: energy-coupling factor transporter transmembrane component T [Candidatus Limnocylindrales bacterium]